jgi:hypothetical protein
MSRRRLATTDEDDDGRWQHKEQESCADCSFHFARLLVVRDRSARKERPHFTLRCAGRRTPFAPARMLDKEAVGILNEWTEPNLCAVPLNRWVAIDFWIYPDRIVGRHCNHRHSRRNASAGCRRGLESARSASCINNLRQIAVACMTYSLDQNGRFQISGCGWIRSAGI